MGRLHEQGGGFVDRILSDQVNELTLCLHVHVYVEHLVPGEQH